MLSPDRAGFEEYVGLRRAALLRTAFLLCGDHDDAEDLVQVALTKVVPRWARIADAPDAYVRTVLVRENVTRWRRRRWREVGVEVVPEATWRGAASGGVGSGGTGSGGVGSGGAGSRGAGSGGAGGGVGPGADDRLDLERALATLAPRQRAVVVLRYYEDLTERQTAEVLGISVGTVKSQTRDALARLRLAAPAQLALAEE